MCRPVPIHTFPAMGIHPLPFVVRVVAIVSAVLVLSGFGHLVNNASASPTPSTASNTEDIPDGFADVMGYTPEQEGGVWLKPEGSCSFPIEIHPPSFETACRQHDLGYDLLRFSAARGEPVSPAHRLSIDRQFHQNLLKSCQHLGCRLLAHLYGLGVTLNSVRQGYGPPTVEPMLPWALVWGGAMVAAMGRPRRWVRWAIVEMGPSRVPAVR